MTPLIMTSRLELRPFRPEDASELHEIFSDPETHTIGGGPLASLAETAAWISRRAEAERQHGLLWYAVRDRDGSRLLGNCGLFAGRTGSAGPEIGYEIRRSRQGRGRGAGGPASHPALAGELSRHSSSPPGGFATGHALLSPPLPARTLPSRSNPGAEPSRKPANFGGPHRCDRPLTPQARVCVHIVPAVSQEPRTTAHPLHGEASLLGHAARRHIAHGVLEVEPVKAGHLESPGRHRLDRLGAHALPPGGRDGPVRDVGGAVGELQVLQGSAAEQDPASRVGHRPVRTCLGRPAALPARDPLPRLGKGVRPLHMPPLDRLILIGIHHGPRIAETPGPQQHAAARRQSRLRPRREAADWNSWGDKTRHGLDYSPVPAFTPNELHPKWNHPVSCCPAVTGWP